MHLHVTQFHCSDASSIPLYLVLYRCWPKFTCWPLEGGILQNGPWWQGVQMTTHSRFSMYFLLHLLNCLEFECCVGHCCLVWSTYTWKVQAWTEWLGKTRDKIYRMFLSSLCEVQSRNISYHFFRNSILSMICSIHSVLINDWIAFYNFAIRGTLQFLNSLVYCHIVPAQLLDLSSISL